MSTADRWIRRSAPNARATLRLFCLPYAGGGTAAFRGWVSELPSEIEVCVICPPGREGRISEPPFRDHRSLVAAIAEAVRPMLDKPYALFGHSMGAFVGFELVRRFRDAGLMEPVHLYPSGHRGPHLPYPSSPMSDLTTPAFIEELRRRNGTPAGVLDSAPLLELLLPLLRADFALCENYDHQPGPRLTCPITVYGGRDDVDVSLDDLRAWSKHTTGSFEVRLFPGDHFFIQQQRSAVLTQLAEDLRADLEEVRA